MTSNKVGIYASQISGHLYTPTGSYDSLATVTVPSGGVASITFAGIPAGYRHLQLRVTARSTRASTGDYMNVRFNGDSGSNYSYHYISCDGSGVGASSGASYTALYSSRISAASAGSNVFGAGILDVLDYANVSKNKTIRSLISYDNNGSGEIYFNSGAWYSTSAVTSITFTCDASFAQYSSFALYGIK